MNTKECIEFLTFQKKESGFTESIEKFNKKIDEIINLLQKHEKIEKEKIKRLKIGFKEEIKTFISIYGFVGNKANGQINFINRLADSLILLMEDD